MAQNKRLFTFQNVKRYFRLFLSCMMFLCLPYSTSNWAADETSTETPATESAPLADNPYIYYALEPDITTNYNTETEKLGFVRVQVVFVINTLTEQLYVEHFAPLLRDAIVSVLAQQKRNSITTPSGQEEIRRECLERVNELMVTETTRKLIVDLLFTKFLYQ